MTKIVVDHENIKAIRNAYESVCESYYNGTSAISELVNVLELATAGELISAVERIDAIRDTLDQAMVEFTKRRTD